jgi:hypothetical protein
VAGLVNHVGEVGDMVSDSTGGLHGKGTIPKLSDDGLLIKIGNDERTLHGVFVHNVTTIGQRATKSMFLFIYFLKKVLDKPLAETAIF